MATIDSTLCTTAEEVTHRTTWVIKNFDYLMQESSDECLGHPTLEIQINPSEEKISNWNIYCWPKLGIGNKYLRVKLGWHWHPRNSVQGTELNVTVAAKLLDSAGNKVPLKEVTSRYRIQSIGSDSNVLDLCVAHEDLLSSADRLMPDGTLTIYIEIKILPSWATVIHGSLQNVVPAQPAQALTPKNIFEDMVDNFVNLKLGSLLIVFQDGEQNCHAFPLAARNVVGGKILLFYSQA